MRRGGKMRMKSMKLSWEKLSHKKCFKGKNWYDYMIHWFLLIIEKEGLDVRRNETDEIKQGLEDDQR